MNKGAETIGAPFFVFYCRAAAVGLGACRSRLRESVSCTPDDRAHRSALSRVDAL
jgi:hypothetical protein